MLRGSMDISKNGKRLCLLAMGCPNSPCVFDVRFPALMPEWIFFMSARVQETENFG
jgi:hypothetical protein